MASRVPLTTSVNWWAMGLHLALLGGAFLLADHFHRPRFALYAVLAFLVLRQGLALTLTAEHRAGIRAVRQGDFARALDRFEHSLEYFTQRPSLDRYRSILLLSASAWSFREMALVNIAFCHGQLGDGASSKAWYERALREFPGSVLATTALAMIQAAERNAPNGDR